MAVPLLSASWTPSGSGADYLRDLAVVGGNSEGVRDDEDADTPGERDPDISGDWLLREQVADRVDDRCHGLVLGERAHRTGHGASRHECRTDERQEDDR